MTNTSSSPQYPAGIRVTLRLKEHPKQQLARPTRKQVERGRDQRARNTKTREERVITPLLSTFLANNRRVTIRKVIMTCSLQRFVWVL